MLDKYIRSNLVSTTQSSWYLWTPQCKQLGMVNFDTLVTQLCSDVLADLSPNVVVENTLYFQEKETLSTD